jgi:hypothetical protein
VPFTDIYFYWQSPLLHFGLGLVPSAEGLGYVAPPSPVVAPSQSSSFELPQLDQSQLLGDPLLDTSSPQSGSVDEDFAPLKELETRGRDWRGRLLPVEDVGEKGLKSSGGWLSPAESLVSAIHISSRAGPSRVKVTGKNNVLIEVCHLSASPRCYD